MPTDFNFLKVHVQRVPDRDRETPTVAGDESSTIADESTTECNHVVRFEHITYSSDGAAPGW